MKAQCACQENVFSGWGKGLHIHMHAHIILLTGNPVGLTFFLLFCLAKAWASSKEKLKSYLLSAVSFNQTWPLAYPLHSWSLHFTVSSKHFMTHHQISSPSALSSNQECQPQAGPPCAWCIGWWLAYMTMHSAFSASKWQQGKWMCKRLIFLPAPMWEKTESHLYYFHGRDSGIQ